MVRGAQFPAGQALEIYDFDAATVDRPAMGVRIATATVGADGTFVATAPLANCGPTTPSGTRFTIAAYRAGDAGRGIAAALATAVFTVGSAPPPALPGLPNTGGGGAQVEPSDAAWAAVRGRLPANVPVYRPAYLPANFRQASEVVNGPFYGVVYRGDGGDLLAFTFGGGNSSPPRTEEPVLVHGVPDRLVTTAGSPPIGVFWSETGEGYAVRAEHGTGSTVISRDELLRVVAGLTPVGADGRAALPGLPNTGGGGAIGLPQRAPGRGAGGG